MRIIKSLSLVVVLFLTLGCDSRTEVARRLESVPNLVAYWDFASENYLSATGVDATLRGEAGAMPTLVAEGPLSDRALHFDGDDYLYIPYAETGALNVQSGEVT
ncbi:MAG: hypothetical protein IJ976_00875, partial [Alistipes sp.]|nr:hypothetical protein [Alistipes sp.]